MFFEKAVFNGQVGHAFLQYHMTAIAIKSSAKDRRDLERLFSSLHCGVLCLCKQLTPIDTTL